MFQESVDAEPHFIPETTLPNPNPQQTQQRTDSEKRNAMRERQRNAKKRRREMHHNDRQVSDEMLRSAPHHFLWNKYVQWAAHRLTSVEKTAEKWLPEHVTSVTIRDDLRLIEQVKEQIGPDYITQGDWKKKKPATPGVACVVLAPSAVRAVHLAKEVYDGRPVGKLFSKHIKIDEQREWLRRCCDKSLAPSAAGTARRVQRLVEEGTMTLAHTSVLVIDFSRDIRLRNILDIDATRVELFQFIHSMVREIVAERRMKILLYVPGKESSGNDDVQEDKALGTAV